jgi:hypothetical protein
VSPVRHFSPREACQTLPLVRRIVEDILAAGRRLRDLSRLHGHELSDNAAGKQALSDLQELLAELESLGCSYKDWNFQIGLVDFPAVIDGQEVLLCWRSDEPDLRFYHSHDAGYAGRREIPPELLPITAPKTANPQA